MIPERYRSIGVVCDRIRKRIKLTDTWRKSRTTIKLEPFKGDELDQAQTYLESIGIKVVGMTNGTYEYYRYLLTDNFETLIKKPPKQKIRRKYERK